MRQRIGKKCKQKEHKRTFNVDGHNDAATKEKQKKVTDMQI